MKRFLQKQKVYMQWDTPAKSQKLASWDESGNIKIYKYASCFAAGVSLWTRWQLTRQRFQRKTWKKTSCSFCCSLVNYMQPGAGWNSCNSPGDSWIKSFAGVYEKSHQAIISWLGLNNLWNQKSIRSRAFMSFALHLSTFLSHVKCQSEFKIWHYKTNFSTFWGTKRKGDIWLISC